MNHVSICFMVTFVSLRVFKTEKRKRLPQSTPPRSTNGLGKMNRFCRDFFRGEKNTHLPFKKKVSSPIAPNNLRQIHKSSSNGGNVFFADCFFLNLPLVSAGCNFTKIVGNSNLFFYLVLACPIVVERVWIWLWCVGRGSLGDWGPVCVSSRVWRWRKVTFWNFLGVIHVCS